MIVVYQSAGIYTTVKASTIHHRICHLLFKVMEAQSQVGKCIDGTYAFIENFQSERFEQWTSLVAKLEKIHKHKFPLQIFVFAYYVEL
jgi:hypothetical protein